MRWKWGLWGRGGLWIGDAAGLREMDVIFEVETAINPTKIKPLYSYLCTNSALVCY